MVHGGVQPQAQVSLSWLFSGFGVVSGETSKILIFVRIFTNWSYVSSARVNSLATIPLTSHVIPKELTGVRCPHLELNPPLEFGLALVTILAVEKPKLGQWAAAEVRLGKQMAATAAKRDLLTQANTPCETRKQRDLGLAAQFDELIDATLLCKYGTKKRENSF